MEIDPPREEAGLSPLRRIDVAVRVDETRKEIVRSSCPGAGACGGMYTANTMASAIEAMGMSLPYSASTPAEDPQKVEECRHAGQVTSTLLV